MQHLRTFCLCTICGYILVMDSMYINTWDTSPSQWAHCDLPTVTEYIIFTETLRISSGLQVEGSIQCYISTWAHCDKNVITEYFLFTLVMHCFDNEWIQKAVQNSSWLPLCIYSFISRFKFLFVLKIMLIW